MGDRFNAGAFVRAAEQLAAMPRFRVTQGPGGLFGFVEVGAPLRKRRGVTVGPCDSFAGVITALHYAVAAAQAVSAPVALSMAPVARLVDRRVA